MTVPETPETPEVIQSIRPQKTLFSLPVCLSGLATTLGVLALTVSLMNAHQVANLSQWQVAAAQNQAIAAPRFQNTDHATPADKRMFAGSANIIADVAEDVAPSVVNIDVQRHGNPIVSSPFNNDFFQRFFGVQPMTPQIQQQVPIIKGNGSGVIISSEGHILTNNHVVQGAEEVTVTLQGGKKYPAHVVGRDPFTDIAVLKIDNVPNLKPAALGSSSNLRPGEWVIAVGSPLGFDHTVTLGIVSALARQVPDINANVDFIQTDAAINPGNSGGPLVNLNGEVIGINTAIAGSGQNIGFAIPIDSVKKITQDLIASGHITRPYVGLQMSEMTPDLAKSLGLNNTPEGVIVAGVVSDSPAYRAGFQQGDIIQRVNGIPVKTAKSVQDMVRAKPVNSEMSIQILRNGQMEALTLRTETLPDSIANPAQANQEQ